MENIVPQVLIIVGAIVVIAGAVTKLTPSKKDDTIFATVKSFIDPILGALSNKGKDSSKK